MHCPSWDDAFVSCLLFYLSRSEFEQVLCDGLWVDFDAVFSVFSEGIGLSDSVHDTETIYLSVDGALNFEKCRSKWPKIQKSAEKFVRTNSYR